jgi:ubiquinone/menaquinone biosynthesis C-methylase UbiE
VKLVDSNCVVDSQSGSHAAHLTVTEAYALWAETYDSFANPLLSLEERYLAPMLPSLEDKTILDLGCGTGRLLDRWSSSSTGRYVGIDMSSAMLGRAAKKLRVPGQLIQADCNQLPLRTASAEVVICSFLLGYVDLRQIAREIARVSKNPANVYLSEFHPDAQSRGWRRSFRHGDRVIELPADYCSPQRVESTFRLHGFDLIQMAEPSFGEPERQVFLANNKSHVCESSRGTRAIFVCHLRRSIGAA